MKSPTGAGTEYGDGSEKLKACDGIHISSLGTQPDNTTGTCTESESPDLKREDV
eukprot:CAMPEP_0204837132 /NCGR_PEP_ID=MMETSP1346-20131115/27246_1 /ASSEMBLY_ACC=CAM_ASM_000771 /TAXON_ID=215587 /ORGANISM="Aplanochytrium stocchinoi, Strain GSBS06" /LENGTH=53 /DNA_ID=CAMNT_0051972415 /DNA_START=48 /DNA_END=206 /DNA_ORIENTATION=+